MPSSETDNRRRSSRVFTRIPVKVRGVNTDGEKFRESCQTIVVNSHGGLLYLNQDVELGSQVLLINPVSEEEQECRVVYLGDTSDKGTRIGVEFLSPAPHFWGVEFTTIEVRGRPSPSASH
ncbi:MAG TPA: PilZ domain-containing protein [Candidatus Acidoferrales bacterium]|nr:PilZ domain-containing protein [Candidatus Acidoferrales bacterium]